MCSHFCEAGITYTSSDPFQYDISSCAVYTDRKGASYAALAVCAFSKALSCRTCWTLSIFRDIGDDVDEIKVVVVLIGALER
jgi:hypothetical protein